MLTRPKHVFRPAWVLSVGPGWALAAGLTAAIVQAQRYDLLPYSLGPWPYLAPVVVLAFAYLRFDLRRATYIGLALASLLILFFSPLILYSPSFLLSFGALLSLVLITRTLDRWLCRLRGFACLFAAGWFARRSERPWPTTRRSRMNCSA